MNVRYATSHDQAGRHSCHAIPGRHSGQGRRCTLAASGTGLDGYPGLRCDHGGDLATFQRYTENVDPAATLVIVTGPGGNLLAGIGMGILVHQKKLTVGVMGMCTSSCALMWIGGETGRKFVYKDRPGVLTFLCFHQASQKTLRAPSGPMLPAPSGPGNAAISKYLANLGYKQDMIEWATAADPRHRRCMNSELAKKFNIDSWYNTEDGQHYSLPGNHGLLPTTSVYPQWPDLAAPADRP